MYGEEAAENLEDKFVCFHCWYPYEKKESAEQCKKSHEDKWDWEDIRYEQPWEFHEDD